MWNAPDRFEWRGIVGQARDEMPVNVRRLIAQKAVVHFFRVERFDQDFGQPADLLHELDALGRR